VTSGLETALVAAFNGAVVRLVTMLRYRGRRVRMREAKARAPAEKPRQRSPAPRALRNSWPRWITINPGGSYGTAAMIANGVVYVWGGDGGTLFALPLQSRHRGW